MKLLSTLILLLFCSLLNGQVIKKTFNTKIDKANKVEIKNSLVNISKADSIFINQIINIGVE